jgi:hypothetical protein
VLPSIVPQKIERRRRGENSMGRSQADDAENEERSQQPMLYTLTSTPTLDGVTPFFGIPWSCGRILRMQWRIPRHDAAGVKGLAVPAAH